MSQEWEQCVSEWADRCTEKQREIDDLKARLAAQERRWSEKPPGTPCWCFYRETERSAYKPVELVMANYCGPLELWQKCEGEMRPLENVVREGGQWFGPLEMPKGE